MSKKKKDVLKQVQVLVEEDSLAEIKQNISHIIQDTKKCPSDSAGQVTIYSNGSAFNLDKDTFINDLYQISDTRTIERTKYYIRRLIKSISEIKSGKINDLNLNRWKEYKDIITDSLWILGKRDKFGVHSASYWGNFIPQIPNQLLRRYTKKGEWILDPFLGSGTTLIECKRLGRNGVGVELIPEIARIANKSIEKESDLFSSRCELIVGDSTRIDFKQELSRLEIESVQFLIMHPPYWNIIKFSNDSRDLSNAKTVDDFLALFGKVVDNTYPLLDKDRYLAIVVGDKYSSGRWFPLGFMTMQEVLKRKYILKSIIVKNFEETRAKRNQKELWRYRALAGGFYVFKHEYIFLFQKKK
jgi:DNA modification methylase